MLPSGVPKYRIDDDPVNDESDTHGQTPGTLPFGLLDFEAAVEYFARHFPWYNMEHYHSGIDYVTPDQCHRGLREKIVAERRDKLERQRRFRKKVNLTRLSALTGDGNGLLISPDEMLACSVMNS